MMDEILSGRIKRAILILRGKRVMLDADLAALYGVETRALNQAVRRNRERFPDDFMFKLTPGETERLRSQSVILDAEPPVTVELGPTSRASSGRGTHRKYRPYAFTEQGVAMLSCVLRSSRAVQVNVRASTRDAAVQR
jgi:hypothetical protein